MQSKLFWRIYTSMAILAVVSIALAGFVSNSLITRHHVETLERELTSDARLVSRLVQDDLGTHNEKIQPTVLSVGKDLKVRTTVILPDGTVIGETDVDPKTMGNHAGREEVRQALKEGIGVAQRPSPTEHILTLYVAVRVGDAEEPKGIVRCALPVAQVEEQMAYFTHVILVCSGLAVGLALVISFIISLRISLPIAHMTEVAEDIAAGNFERHARVTAGGELARLGDALNAMRATLVSQITAIERNRGQLETIVSAMSEGVVALDSGERILVMNDAAAAVFETTRAEAVGRMLWEVCRNPALAQYVAQSRAASSPQTFQWSSQGGRQRYYELTIVPVAAPAKKAGAGIPAIILAFHDVTALRKLERMRVDFIANVSHELKSPLTSIIGFVETLRDGALNDPAKAVEFIEIIQRQTRRLDRLVADLLELSTIEAPDYAPDKQPLSLADVAAKIKESLSQRISQKNLKVDINAQADVPPVPADRTRMEQVFMNLLDNAVKYTDPGGSITVNISRLNGAVKVAVRDTGIGIPSRDLPRIFERFYRVDKARSREMGGTGLGLAIVKHIILQHGGAVHAESILGEGTTITFTLPVK